MEARARRLTLVIAAVVLASVGVAGAAGGRDDARGTGKWPDPNAPETSFSFNFSATNTSSSGLDARGRFVLVNTARGAEFRARVICLKVTGNRAVIGGVVTSAKGQAPGEPVGPGDSLTAFAEDNGKSRLAPDNISIFTFHDPAPSTDLCNGSESGPLPIRSGRITVRDR